MMMMMVTTRIFWMLSFYFVVTCILPFCDSSTYIFTQYKKGVSVCMKVEEDKCESETHPIFDGNTEYGTGMTLGFLNSPSDKFYHEYDMAKYGFPIFYEWDLDHQDYVNFMIANGKLDKTKQGRGLYYYVQVKNFTGLCKTFPSNSIEASSGALYLNQKYAKFAYFVYQSSASTCILTFEFEDLLRGDFLSDKPTEIVPQEVTIIDHKILDYRYFTIDPIFGTMVYLIRTDFKYYAVHYNINENNLDVLEEVYRFELQLAQWSEFKRHYTDPHSEPEKLPFFTSYGKFVTIFYTAIGGRGLRYVEYFSPNVSLIPGNFYQFFHQRIFYLLDERWFENGEPFGKFVEPSTPATSITTLSLETTTTTSYESSSLAIPKKPCPLLTWNFWGFIGFLILDILFAGILGAVIFLSCLGSKRINKRKTLKAKPKKRTKKSTPHHSTTPGTVLPQTDLNSRPSTNFASGTTQATNVTKAGPPQTTVFKTWEQSNATGTTPATGGGTTQKTTAFQTWKNA